MKKVFKLNFNLSKRKSNFVSRKSSPSQGVDEKRLKKNIRFSTHNFRRNDLCIDPEFNAIPKGQGHNLRLCPFLFWFRLHRKKTTERIWNERIWLRRKIKIKYYSTSHNEEPSIKKNNPNLSAFFSRRFPTRHPFINNRDLQTCAGNKTFSFHPNRRIEFENHFGIPGKRRWKTGAKEAQRARHPSISNGLLIKGGGGCVAGSRAKKIHFFRHQSFWPLMEKAPAPRPTEKNPRFFSRRRTPNFQVLEWPFRKTFGLSHKSGGVRQEGFGIGLQHPACRTGFNRNGDAQTKSGKFLPIEFSWYHVFKPKKGGFILFLVRTSGVPLISA